MMPNDNWYDDDDRFSGGEMCPEGEHSFRVLSAVKDTDPQKLGADGKPVKWLTLECQPEDDVPYRLIHLYLHKRSAAGKDLTGWMCDDIGKMTGSRPNNARDLDRAIDMLNRGRCRFQAMVIKNAKDYPAIERSSIKPWGEPPKDEVEEDEETPF